MKSLVRIIAAVSGALLLALVAPHTNPWTMSLLPLSGGTLSLELAGRTLDLPLWLLLVSAACVVLAPWPLILLRRESGPAVFDSRADRLLFVACLALLILSLVPVATRGRGSVTYLLLGASGLLLLTCGIPSTATLRFDSWRQAFTERLRAIPAGILVPTVLLFVIVVASLGSLLVLGRIPHVVDSAAQLFHARTFLAGELTAAAPEPESAFQFTHMIQGDRWYSQYPPGHTLLLALGLLFGGLGVALLYFVGREMFDESTGRTSLLLGAISPFVWLMSSSQMSHSTMLFFVCLFLFGFVHLMKHGQNWAALLAGFAAGFALNIRPLTAVAVVTPFVLYAGLEQIRGFVRPVDRVQTFRLARAGLLALAAFVVPLGALLIFNRLTNGHPFVFGYEALYGKQALLGFGKEGWWGTPHTPWRGLTATLNNLNALNQYLFGLPLPSLALVLTGFAAMKRTRWDWLLAVSAAGPVVAYLFYWYQDLTYGPRFLYAAVAPLILLTARFLIALPALLERLVPDRRLCGSVGIALALAFVYGWTINVPQMAGFYSRNYYGANPEIPRTVAETRLTEAVVLVPDHYYPSLFPLNAPALDGDVTFARDLGPARNRELAGKFPTRTLYRLRSHDEYRLIPYDPESDRGVVAYTLEAGSPFALELLSFQLSHLANGAARDHWTGELGNEFRNHDQLWISADGPGLEAGIILDAARDETRALELWVTRSPDSGVLEIRLNGSLLRPAIDLYSRRIGVERLRVDRLPLHAGRNGLLLRVPDKNRAARGFGLGLDYLRLE